MKNLKPFYDSLRDFDGQQCQDEYISLTHLGIVLNAKVRNGEISYWDAQELMDNAMHKVKADQRYRDTILDELEEILGL